MWEFHKVRSESHRAARDLFLKAMAAAPESADPHIWLARVDAGLAIYRWSDDPEAILSEGMASAVRAVQLDEKNPYSHYAVAITHTVAGDVERGLKAAERATSLSPSFALGHLVLGLARLFSGNALAAIDDLQRGLRLNPFDPQNFTWHLEKALAHYFSDQPREGLEEARRSLEIRPHWFPALKVSAACHMALNDRSTAGELLKELQAGADTSGDVLTNLAKHRPEWMAQIECSLRPLTLDVGKTASAQ